MSQEQAKRIQEALQVAHDIAEEENWGLLRQFLEHLARTAAELLEERFEEENEE